MLKTFEIILDIEKDLYNATQQSFAVSQNDLDTVELNFAIMQDGAALDLTGTSIQLAIKKPSSLVVYQDVEIIDAAAGEARVRLNNQAYIEFGIYIAEIYIRDAESLAVTCPFYYFSRTSVMGDESLESITEWTDFQAALFNYDKKPLILEGVPNQIPDYIGQTAFDVTDGLVFIANGNTAASWQLIGGGGGDGGGSVATWNTIIGKPDLFPPTAHTHAMADVTGLADALEAATAPDAPVEWVDVQNKPDVFPPAAHSHTFAAITDKPTTYPPSPHLHVIGDVTGLQTALDGKADVGDVSTAPAEPVEWIDILNKPATYPPTAHSHDFAAITNKPATYPATAHSHTFAEITAKPATYPATAHVHAVADVTGLQDSLDAKADDTDLAGKANLNHTHTAANITDFGTAVAGAIPADYLTETEGDARYAIKGTQPGTTAVAWGDIAGTIANQADLQTALNGKADDADLAGKADVNHTHTFTAITNKPATYPPDVHTHAFADITAKPETYPAAPHVHAIADVTDLQASLDAKADDTDLAAKADIDHTHAFADITAKPDTYPATAHTHAMEDVTGLQAALDGKVDDTEMAGKADVNHSHAFADITAKPATYPPDTHSHAFADITAKPATYPPDVHTHAFADITAKPATYPPPLMGGNQVGGAMVGNGLAMSTNYLFVKTATGLVIDATNSVAIDRTVVNTWYAAAAHNHTAANITDFGTAVAAAIPGEYVTTAEGEAAYAAKTHTHDFAAITNKPATYAPTAHTHAVADVTGLQAALDGKVDDAQIVGMATTGYVDTADNVILNNVLGGNKIWTGTQAAYDLITTKDAKTLYFITS